ncbi:MAG: cadmium-translocating P-type ATPase [Ignavibacteriales bacterium]|nr:cadmium-translocating P-type ATPase [Ignavibacteriales bacterium]
MPELRHSTIHIEGLCCATEEQAIRKKLSSLNGVHRLDLRIVSKKLEVDHTCEPEIILDSLNAIGLPGSPHPPGTLLRAKTPNRQLLFTVLSGIFFGIGLLLKAIDIHEPLPLVLFLSSIVVGGWRIAFKAMKAVAQRSLDMNFLMTIAVIGALVIGEYAEAAAVVFLFALSLLLESMSIDRSRRAIQSLMKLSPSTATVRLNAKERDTPVEQVRVGQTVIIRPGERIPLDGQVSEGSSSVDQAPLTGESMPVLKSPGDAVYAGSFNQRGVLEVTVTRPSNDSTLARIIHLVEEAQSKKAPSQTFIERFARVYTPSVFILSLLVMSVPPLFFGAGFADWFYRALVLLVIACPCALVISTPVTVVSALTVAARSGVLIKGGKHLEVLAGVKAVALDKTGTVTMGKATVTDIVPLNSRSPKEILAVSAAIESKSEHHLAEAFLRRAYDEHIEVNDLSVRDFHALTGRGVRASVDGKEYVLGNHPLAEELGFCSPEIERILNSLEHEGKTTVILAEGAVPVGVIGIADEVRGESNRAVGALREIGVRHIALLTGDNRGTAESISPRLGTDSVHAELLPEDKLKAIESLRKNFGNVAMIGDGINDAPALAAADVGIAMGGVGSDTALETADIVLMSDNLARVPEIVKLGKKTLRIIRQNIAIALVTKGVFLGLGVLGLTSLWLAILADDGATLVVILNSLRLLRSSLDG